MDGTGSRLDIDLCSCPECENLERRRGEEEVGRESKRRLGSIPPIILECA